jgi:hypothetical protein
MDWEKESERYEKLQKEAVASGLPIFTAQHEPNRKTFFIPFSDEEKNFWKSFAGRNT